MRQAGIFGFAEDAAPVRQLAERLGAPHGLIDLKTFPDGETLPTVAPNGATTVILYRSLHQPNERLLPLLLAADAFRRAGVGRLVLVAPYLAYLRQDMVFQPGQSLSRDVVCGLLGAAFDRLVTVQAHLHRTASLAGVLGVPATNLDIAGDLAILAAGGGRPLVVGPDSESRPWVQAAASRLGTDWAAFDKQRLGDRQVALTLDPGVQVAGRAVLLLDDICSSGGTLAQAIAQLRDAGAASIDVAVAHAMFDAGALDRLRAAGAGRILSSDSVPHSSNTLELAGVLAAALQDEIPA
ncbi:MAG: ribose-phosphate diphosphokinase [Caulobacter sp.]